MEDLPEELKLCILGCLDTKEAIQTTKLSKNWVSLWTRIPVLEINSLSFHNRGNFYKFFNEVLSRRDPLAKLDSLKFNFEYDYLYTPWCNAKILKRVFDYAFSHDVKHLEASIKSLPYTDTDSWPISLYDSLKSLKLTGPMRCPFLGPARSVFFKNLTVLYLQGARITDVEPFSGFPVLESLTLLYCQLWENKDNESQTLKVHALRLSDLTISYCQEVKCLDLITPRLRFLNYQGYELLKHEGLPVLETLKINFDGFRSYYRDKEAEKRVFDELMSLFSTLSPNIKSLTVFHATVLLLSLFPDELVRRGSPFRKLKDLKLDLTHVNYRPTLFHKPCNGWYSFVKAYLLHNSPDVEPTLTYPKDDIDDMEWLWYDDDSSWFDDEPWETLQMHAT